MQGNNGKNVMTWLFATTLAIALVLIYFLIRSEHRVRQLSEQVGAFPGRESVIAGTWDPGAELERMRMQMGERMNATNDNERFSLHYGFNGPDAVPLIEFEETPSGYIATVIKPTGQEMVLSARLENHSLILSGNVSEDLRLLSGRGENGTDTARIFSRFSEMIPLEDTVDPDSLDLAETPTGYRVSVSK